MPNRMIRDGLLDSERYWSVTIEARQLFIHLMLLADDFGCVSLAPLFLRRRCFNDTPSTEKIGRLVTELSDADLIRCYDVERSCYAFIPRFGQRLQRETLKHPKPPEQLFKDDDEALAKFKKIKKETEISTVPQPLASVGQPPEVKRREEKKDIPGVRRSTKTTIPDGYTLSDRMRSWALENGVFNLDAHFAYFVNQAKAKAYRYADWDRALMNAVLTDWAKIGRGSEFKRVAL